MELKNKLVKGSVWSPTMTDTSIPRGNEKKGETLFTVEILNVDFVNNSVTLVSRPTETFNIPEFLAEHKLVSMTPIKEPIKDILSKAVGSIAKQLGISGTGGKTMRKLDENDQPINNTIDIPDSSPVQEKETQDVVVQKTQKKVVQDHVSLEISEELKSVLTLSKKSIVEFEGDSPSLDKVIKLLGMFPDVTLKEYVEAMVNTPSMENAVMALIMDCFRTHPDWVEPKHIVEKMSESESE